MHRVVTLTAGSGPNPASLQIKGFELAPRLGGSRDASPEARGRSTEGNFGMKLYTAAIQREREARRKIKIRGKKNRDRERVGEDGG